MNNQVAIKHIDNYNVNHVQKTLNELFAACETNKLFKNNAKVLIKINAGLPVCPDAALTTHPAVVQALVNILSDLGAKCVVADAPQKQYTLNALDKIYFETGMLDVANSTKCQLNHDLSVAKLDIPNGVKTKSAIILQQALEADVIVNVGKLRVDDNLGLLGVSAGIFGLIPGDVQNQVLNRLTTVEDFYNFNIDLIDRLKDKIILNIFDGVVALEANASQRMLSCLAVAENMFSLDAVICKIVGKEYEDAIIKTAAKRGLVNFEKPFELVSGDIKELELQDFDFGEQTIYSNIHKNLTAQKRYFNKYQQRVIIDPDKCKGCGRCAKICPANAILMKYDKNGELYAQIDYKKCIFCNKCYAACPYKVVDLKSPLGYKMVNFNITKYNKDK